MKVIKKVNNNVAIAINEKGQELFVVGKGLGFRKTPYELDNNDVIEKIYVSPKNIKMFDILNDIPIEDICLAEEIIQIGREILNKELSQNIILLLSDHISYAIQRTKEGEMIRNPLEWEIKSIYPKEVEVGRRAIEIIYNRTGIELPQSESTLIALHFVNAQLNIEDMKEITKITKIIGEILSIIKYNLNMDFDESTHDFTRFATHIKYFAYRQINNKSFNNENESIYNFVKDKYPKEVNCVEKIEKFLNKNYDWNCSIDEKLYLVLHIHRLAS
ncbi:PRD domain-containing protein [Alkalibaculum sp. M08DMB]|uniref:PRD domain-containing protein n=1 Tax=Alkalibaculum sporogenes TaxID=2655001 RepID=A0A6A7KDR4_9FIRM|nr:PRD domain-containing protein [Alkalibaculum sporogenes]MPW27287.1 PRD domain-containing protein [Alkalibaculum sporogenes]